MLMRRVLQQCGLRRTLRPVLVLPLAARSCTCQSRLRGSLALERGQLLQSLQPKGTGMGIGTGPALLLACGCPGSTAWSARPRSCRLGCLAHRLLLLSGQPLVGLGEALLALVPPGMRRKESGRIRMALGQEQAISTLALRTPASQRLATLWARVYEVPLLQQVPVALAVGLQATKLRVLALSP